MKTRTIGEAILTLLSEASADRATLSRYQQTLRAANTLQGHITAAEHTEIMFRLQYWGADNKPRPWLAKALEEQQQRRLNKRERAALVKHK